jgi:hypothetical protein
VDGQTTLYNSQWQLLLQRFRECNMPLVDSLYAEAITKVQRLDFEMPTSTTFKYVLQATALYQKQPRAVAKQTRLTYGV